MFMHTTEADRIEAEAVDWLMRWDDVSEPVTAKEQARWLAWLGQSPAHVKAFLALYDSYAALEGLDSKRQIDIDDWLSSASAAPLRLLTPATPTSTHPSSRPKASQRRLLRLGSAAAALIAIVTLLGGHYWLDHRSFKTVVGEQRTVKLPDGSTMILNTRSRAVIAFDRRHRSIELSGEALFYVSRDASRPFLVITHDAITQALGTQFNVNAVSGTQTDVTVIQGLVQVSSSGTGPQGGESSVSSEASLGVLPVVLGAGEEAQVGRDGISKRGLPNAQRATAWRQHVLVFESTPLTSVAGEFSRYNRVQFEIDPAIGESIRLSGTFDALYPQSLLLYLQDRKDLRVIQDGDRIVVTQRNDRR